MAYLSALHCGVGFLLQLLWLQSRQGVDMSWQLHSNLVTFFLTGSDLYIGTWPSCCYTQDFSLDLLRIWLASVMRGGHS